MQNDNNSDDRPDIHDQRELHKMAIDSYFIYFQNPLDYELEKIMKNLIELRDGHYNHFNAFEKMKREEPEKFIALADQSGKSPEELIAQGYDSAMDAHYVEEELNAFAEVQIIYAYKHLEIHIKRLLDIGYGIKNSRQLFKWNTLIEFLKAKSILIEQLEGYTEINQLRRVNNAVKHSDGLQGNEFDDIPELKRKKYTDAESLLAFYARIKNVPNQFIAKLGGAIYNERFTFNEDRLKDMSTEIASRMDKDIAEIFIERLRGFYK